MYRNHHSEKLNAPTAAVISLLTTVTGFQGRRTIEEIERFYDNLPVTFRIEEVGLQYMKNINMCKTEVYTFRLCRSLLDEWKLKAQYKYISLYVMPIVKYVEDAVKANSITQVYISADRWNIAQIWLHTGWYGSAP